MILFSDKYFTDEYYSQPQGYNCHSYTSYRSPEKMELIPTTSLTLN